MTSDINSPVFENILRTVRFSKKYVIASYVFITSMYAVVHGVQLISNSDPLIHDKYKITFVNYYKYSTVTASMMMSHMYSCQPYYFGKDCWLFCAVTTRNTCSPTGKLICRTGWRFVIVVLNLFKMNIGLTKRVFDKKLYKHRCIVFDLCTYQPCYKPNHTCVPTGNITYLCEHLRPKYWSSDQPDLDNVTSTSVVQNESIWCLSARFNSTLIANFTKIYWDIGPNSPMHVIANGQLLTFDLHAYAGWYYNLSCVFLIFGIVTIKFVVKFMIEVPPQRIWFENLSIGLDHVVYTSQRLTCMCDNQCYRREVKYEMFLNGDSAYNYNEKRHYVLGSVNHIFLPTDFELGFIEVRCDVIFHFQDLVRLPTRIFNTKKLILNDFVHFAWDDNTEEVRPQTKIYCNDFSYLHSAKIISQTLGPTNLIINNLNGYLTVPDNVIGGRYRVHCSLTIIHTKKDQMLPMRTYYRFKEFDVIRRPTFVCFKRFPHIRGAVIECDHNGFPTFTQSIYMSLESIDDGVIVASAYSNRLRIPYNHGQIQYQVWCEINYTDIEFTNITDTLFTSFQFEINHDVHKRYSMLPDDYKCNKLSQAIVSEDFHFYPGGDFSFDVRVFYFDLFVPKYVSPMNCSNCSSVKFSNETVKNGSMPLLAQYAHTVTGTVFITANTSLLALNIVILTRLCIGVRTASALVVLLRINRLRLAQIRKMHIHKTLVVFSNDLRLQDHAKKSLSLRQKNSSTALISFYVAHNPFGHKKSYPTDHF